MRRVEWIGVATPLTDDRVNYRRMVGLYTADEEAMLETITEMLSPMVKSHGKTARVKGQADGYDRRYQWGPKHYVVDMLDHDADRLFSDDPDGREFVDLDREDRAMRSPEVPWPYIGKMLHRIMDEAKNGPGMVKVAEYGASSAKQIDDVLQRAHDARQARASDRGIDLARRGRR